MVQKNIQVQHHKSTVSHSVSHSQTAPSTASCSQATCNFIQVLLLQKGEKSFLSRLYHFCKKYNHGQFDFCFKTLSIFNASNWTPHRLLTSSTTSKLLEPNCFQPSTRRTCMCSQRRVRSFEIKNSPNLSTKRCLDCFLTILIHPSRSMVFSSLRKTPPAPAGVFKHIWHVNPEALTIGQLVSGQPCFCK